MVALEAQMDVLIEVSAPIHFPATFVASRRRDLNARGFQLRKRTKTAHLSDKLQIPAIREVVQERYSAERIDRHTSIV
jgi:hypothetical protein